MANHPKGRSNRGQESSFEAESRRGFEDIIACVIAACGEGQRKTKVMYNSMVNLRQINRYLELLLSKGLISTDRENRTYSATARGMRYLEEHEDLARRSKEMSTLQTELSSMLVSTAKTSRPDAPEAGPASASNKSRPISEDITRGSVIRREMVTINPTPASEQVFP